VNTYCLDIQAESPFLTPLQSDTIFGHIAWAIVYDQGENRLQQVLAEFRSGNPPFLVSSAFPRGMLPLPILPAIEHGGVEKLSSQLYSDGENVSSLRKTIEKIKRLKKVQYLDIGSFPDIAQSLTTYSLTWKLLSTAKNHRDDITEERTVMHTAVNRITGVAQEGALFPYDEIAYQTRLSIWFKLSDISWKPELERWLKIIEGSGFGKRKSVGLGQFKIASMTEAHLPEIANPNAFMALSSFIPKENDPIEGYYKYIVKRGKLGGPWALGGRVWKKPLLMLASGSIFYSGGKIQSHYGSLIPEIHQDRPEVAQYALAFPLGIRLGEQII
jgi:CRISPR-associated protein Csm4